MTKGPRKRHTFATLLVVIGVAWAAHLSLVENVGADSRTSAVNWLISEQNDDGSWGESPASAILSTAAVMDAFASVGTFGPSYTAATVWLASIEPTVLDENSGGVVSLGLPNDDLLARRIYALGQAGQLVANDVENLTRSQKSDGGWGLHPDFGSDVLDTAVAMRALAAATGAASVEGAIAFLRATQNGNGGWGLVSGDQSEVYYTALAVIGLELTSSAVVDPVIVSAGRYLLSQQLVDGSWGDVPSTALATIAVVRSGGDRFAIAAAVEHLLGQQRANGSWNDEAYSTSLAIQALKLAEPLGPDIDDDLDGLTEREGDCNDQNAAVHPGAVDSTVDGIDQDCNGIDGVPMGDADNDGDGVSIAQGDCNDANAAIHPGAADIPGNGIDENCDGFDAFSIVEIQSLSLAKVVGGVEQPASSFGPYETVAIHVSVSDPTVPVTVFVTDPTGQVLNVSEQADAFQFNTAGRPPGSYTVTAWALDAATGVVLDEAVAPLTVTGSVGVSGGRVVAIPGFTHVGATEEVVLAASLTNGSNIPGDVTLNFTVRTPSGVVIASGSQTTALDPQAATVDVALGSFSHPFTESGAHPIEVQVLLNGNTLRTLTGVIASAPRVRIEPTLRVTPGMVLPDGDKRIRIEIQLEGVEQSP